MTQIPLAQPGIRKALASAIMESLLGAGVGQVEAPRIAAKASEMLLWGQGGSAILAVEGSRFSLEVRRPEPAGAPPLSDDIDRVEVRARPHARAAAAVTMIVECPLEVPRVDVDGALSDPRMRLGLVESLAADLRERNRELEALYHELEKANQGTLALNAELERSVEARSRFLASLSHEIRTPLNGIMGTARILLNETTDPRHRNRLDLLLTSSDHLLTLLNDVLDLAKIDAGRITLEEHPFPLRQVIEQSLAIMARPALDKGLDLYYCWAPGTPEQFIGDQDRLRQIVVNLVSNAVKYTETGSVKVAVSLAGDIVVIDVKDTGIGIAQHRVERLFEPFEQDSGLETRRIGGTGLGLTITRELVQLMGGEVVVDSKVAEGSQFRVEVPLEAVPTEPTPPPEGLRDRAVAVIPGDTDEHACVMSMMRQLGLKPRARALDDEHSEPYFVLDADHIDLSAALAQLGRERVVVLVRPESGAEDDIEGLPPGSVPKPISFQRLQDALELVVAGQVPSPARERGTLASELGKEVPLRILVAEDNALNRLVLVDYLEAFGYKPTTAASGDEALSQAKAGGFDLIFMDFEMPGMDGLAATRAILTGVLDPPRIVGLTAHVLPSYRQAGLDAGMEAVLPKPIQIASLANEIRKTKPVRPLRGETENEQPA